MDSKNNGICKNSDMSEIKISSEHIFDGRIISVVRDKVRLPNGKISTREVVRHRGAACVVPVKDDGKIVFVRQYRYAIAAHTIEIPAGKLDPGEDPKTCAVRELSEETGYTATNIIPLGILHSSIGFSDEAIYMYAATGISLGEVHPDEDEFVNTIELDTAEAVDMIMSGKITDGKTQAAVLKFLQLQKFVGEKK